MKPEYLEDQIELIFYPDSGSERTPQVDALMACYDEHREEIRFLKEQVYTANQELLRRPVDQGKDLAQLQHAYRLLADAHEKQSKEIAQFKALFARHSAREKYIAEIVHQHIQHGDEQHRAWLREELINVLCREDTKACKTFDDLIQEITRLRGRLDLLEMEA